MILSSEKQVSASIQRKFRRWSAFQKNTISAKTPLDIAKKQQQRTQEKKILCNNAFHGST